MPRREINGERLRAIREARELSQEELSRLAGIDPIHISRLEREETKHPYPKTVRALAKALEVDPDELRKDAGEGGVSPLVLRPYAGSFADRMAV
jgi:transcriptional regulator with XRE-family HTH domain